MQRFSVKVSQKFYQMMIYSRLSPIRITPTMGYFFKHHFVIEREDPHNFILYGVVSSAVGNEITGDVTISIDGEHEEVVQVIK